MEILKSTDNERKTYENVKYESVPKIRSGTFDVIIFFMQNDIEIFETKKKPRINKHYFNENMHSWVFIILL